MTFEAIINYRYDGPTFQDARREFDSLISMAFGAYTAQWSWGDTSNEGRVVVRGLNAVNAEQALTNVKTCMAQVADMWPTGGRIR